MRVKYVQRILFSLLLILPGYLNAQNFSFNCSRDTIISGCAIDPCFTLRTIVPDVRSSSNTYKVSRINSNDRSCFPVYSEPSVPGNPTSLVMDDRYSGVINIGFPFSFFGTTYNNLVVGSNGTISFDESLAGDFAHYGLLNQGGILGEVGAPENLPSVLYDAAQIMGAYHDMDITIGTSPNRRIRYLVTGAAPNRKWIVSFFELPLFGCGSSYQNTSQIILNEGTGIVEVFLYDKQTCAAWNGGRAIVGMQDATKTQAIMAPGRSASDLPWGTPGMNEGWRFIPSDGPSLFLRAELYQLGNATPLATVTTPQETADGNLEILFPNICAPDGATTTYVVKSVYTKYNEPGTEVAGYDTVRVVRSAATDLGATATATASDCGNTGNGVVTATVPAGNGSGTFEYSLISNAGPWQSSNSFNNLAPGPYTVYVRDVNGSCGSAVDVVVPSTGQLPVTFNVTGSSCSGARNGRIEVNAGTSPTLEYRIGTNSWQTSNVFTDLLGGFYFISVRDLHSGCEATNIRVDVPTGSASVTGTATPTPTSCAGLSNGAITVMPTSGSGPYQYSINNGAAWQDNNIFTGLAPGNYSVFIREVGGCTSAPISAEVVSGDGLSVMITPMAPTCTMAANGEIIISIPPGPTPPYSAYVNGELHTSSTDQDFFLLGMTVGTYTVYVTDATGCSSTPATVVISALPSFTATVSALSASCPGATDGSIQVTPHPPGMVPFTATVLPGNISQTGDGPFNFGNLAPGVYFVTVQDAVGCTYTSGNITVSAGSGLTVSTSFTDATCQGTDNGTIQVTTNGVAPYTFVLDGTTVINSNDATVTFDQLPAGAHTINVIDASGCTLGTPVTITLGYSTGISANHTTTGVSCFGASDGRLDISIVDAGAAPYTFILNGTITQVGTDGTIFTGLAAGTNYSVEVRDSRGCSYLLNNITITQPTVLSATAIVSQVLCNGASNGQIEVTAAGGTAPYSYSLNNIDFQGSPVFSVEAGNYQAYVRDANGCNVSVPDLTVTEPLPLQANVVATNNATCEGGDNGTIELNASGGTAPYTYSVDQGATFRNGPILNVAPGTYTVIVRDAAGCEYVISDVVVGLTNNLTITPTADPAPVCEGSSVGLQVISNANTFNWTPATGMSSPTVANPTVSPTTTTTYTVTASLGQCSITDDVVVTVMPAPIANAGGDATICTGQDYQLQGSGGVSYTWSPDTYLNDVNSATASVMAPTQTTVYSLQVTDANGCTSLQPGQMTLTVTPPILIAITPADTVVYPGATVQLLAVSPANNYNWTPFSYLDNPSVANPTFVAPGVGEVLTYQVSGTTDEGCRGEGSVTIRVYAGPEIYVPTAFTPNGDGLNDLFFPFPVGIQKLDYFRVFNRWGEQVFTTSALGAGWNGTSFGKEQPAGVYVWQLQAVMDGNIIIRKQGTVTLIR